MRLMFTLDLDYNRQDHRLGARQFLDKSFQLYAYMLFQETLVVECLTRSTGDGGSHNSPRIFQRSICGIKTTHTPHDNLRLALNFACLRVNSHYQCYQPFIRHLAALLDRLASNFFESSIINKRSRNVALLNYLRALAVQLEHVAILDRKSTRLNSSHIQKSRMPSSA